MLILTPDEGLHMIYFYSIVGLFREGFLCELGGRGCKGKFI